MSAIPPRSLAVLAAVALLLTGCGGSGGSATERRPSGTETLPPQGEYSYMTSGFERLSAVVASRHGYPRVSSVTVTREGCGFGERWEPRPERSSESQFCVAGARW